MPGAFGGPSGSTGSGGGSTANVFAPPSQGAIGQDLSAGLQGLYGLATDIPGYGTGFQNPYSGQALGGAIGAQQAGPGVAANQYNASNQLYGGGSQALGLTPNLIANAFNPEFGQLSYSAEGDPYGLGALQGAQQGAAIGGTAAGQAGANSSMISGSIIPYLSQLMGQLGGLGGEAAGHAGDLLPFAQQQAQAAVAPIGGLQSGANQLLQTGFDPQQALYNRASQQTTDQTRAALASAGLSGSPYAAGVEGQTAGDFNINWQNQQEGRQATALQGAGAADATAGNLAGLGTSIYGQGLQALNQGLGTAGNLYSEAGGIGSNIGGLANTALGLGQGGAALAGQAGQMPASAFYQQLNSILPFLQAENQAGYLGATGVGNALGSAGGAFNNASNLSGAGLQTGLSTAAAPYNQLQSEIGNAQQSLNPLQNYLTGGQNASALSGQLGQQGVNQLYQGLGGLGQLAGGAGGLRGIGSGLFGTGTGQAAGAVPIVDETGALLSAGDTAAVTASPGGAGLLAALPFSG